MDIVKIAKDAAEMHPQIEQYGVSLDALFIALTLAPKAPNQKAKRPASKYVPTWPRHDLDTVRMYAAKSRKSWVTASEIFEAAFLRKATQSDAQDVARTLRADGYVSRRYGGKTQFNVARTSE